jgi:hypothetical protein
MAGGARIDRAMHAQCLRVSSLAAFRRVDESPQELEHPGGRPSPPLVNLARPDESLGCG